MWITCCRSETGSCWELMGLSWRCPKSRTSEWPQCSSGADLCFDVVLTFSFARVSFSVLRLTRKFKGESRVGVKLLRLPRQATEEENARGVRRGR